MACTVSRDAIVASLSAVTRCVEARNIVPILGCTLLTFHPDRVELTGTNMEMALQASVPAVCDEGGSVAVPAKALLGFVKSVPKGSQIAMTASDDGLKVSAGGMITTLPVSKVEDFPTLTAGMFAHEFRMPMADLHRMMRHTAPAMSNEECRQYLNGFFLAPKNGMLRAVATDGHRLVISDVPLPSGAAGMEGVIFPRESAGALMGMFGAKPSGDVVISVACARVMIKFNGMTFLTKLVDGTFPEYERVIPRPSGNVLRTDAGELAKLAVSMSKAVSNEGSQPVKLTLGGEKCLVSAMNYEGGRSEGVLNGITKWSGEALEVGYQARYLKTLLGLVSGPVQFDIPGMSAPCTITSEADPHWKAVLMPMRT